MTAPSDFRLRKAAVGDLPDVMRCIRGIAEYEGLSHEVVATEDGLRQSLFGDPPAAEVVLAYAGEELAGFAVYFHNFSTFAGRRGMYLEDLFVFPQFRRKGLGRKLLAYVARAAVERECGRFEWAALDWNETAISFYTRLGARPMDEWTVYRMTGDALAQLAREG